MVIHRRLPEAVEDGFRLEQELGLEVLGAFGNRDLFGVALVAGNPEEGRWPGAADTRMSSSLAQLLGPRIIEGFDEHGADSRNAVELHEALLTRLFVASRHAVKVDAELGVEALLVGLALAVGLVEKVRPLLAFRGVGEVERKQRIGSQGESLALGDLLIATLAALDDLGNLKGMLDRRALLLDMSRRASRSPCATFPAA